MTSQVQCKDGLVCMHVSDPCDCPCVCVTGHDPCDCPCVCVTGHDPCDCPCVCHRADVCLCGGYEPVGQCDTVNGG